MTPNAILLRYNEIFLKGGNRHVFERLLRRNIAARLRPMGFTVERLHGRVVALGDSGGPEGRERFDAALAALEQVFGLVSMSVAVTLAADLDGFKTAAVALTRAALEQRRKSGLSPRPTFKVETRRSDKSFPLRSPDISAEIGHAIITALDLPVDVHHPEMVIGVEVGTERSFVFGESRPGPGGLPVGGSGQAVLLLSGGIDSPVAGWMTLKRGCRLVPLYFHSFPYTGDKTQEKVVDLCRILARWQGHMTLRVAPFTAAQEAIRAACPAELLVVLYRRLMMRVADRIAVQTHAGAIATGENLGQVASQTLENLGVINQAARHVVLRPLIAQDKTETIALARRIGTYDTSILPYEDCCSLFVPRHPATKAKLADVERAESRLDLEALTEQVVAGVKVIDIQP
jgi:thiamine biosynthesis protein ThiI